MRFDLNWYQRVVLIVAGLLMLFFAMNSSQSFAGADNRLATGQFVVAIVLFFVAASSRKREA